MNKFDYFISGVWKNAEDRITHVLLHKAHLNGNFETGEKRNEQEVIDFLKQGGKVCVIVWKYPGWQTMAEVGYVEGEDRDFLRTNRNDTAVDNLNNLIDFQNYYG